MKRSIDEKAICFIICSNDELYTEECIYYIARLYVPEDYHVDVLTIQDAVSMTAGYNEGMRASDAKYKVYLHQDVFSINWDFIQDILDIFMGDESIGMIGMVGAPKLPASGIMWEEERCGSLYAWSISETSKSLLKAEKLTEVEVVDGFLMATQYDVPWREDLFDKWDFYDCSQCKEFARQGYKIVVPAQEEPWCIHDSGLVNEDNYEGERQKFVKEYYNEIGSDKEMNMDKHIIREKLNTFLAEGNYEGCRKLLLTNEESKKIIDKTNDFVIAKYMLSACEQEKKEGEQILFEKVKSLEELVNRYTKLMFYLRRLDFEIGTESEYIDEFNQFLAQNQVSSSELLLVLYCSVPNIEKVLQIVKDKMESGEIVL